MNQSVQIQIIKESVHPKILIHYWNSMLKRWTIPLKQHLNVNQSESHRFCSERPVLFIDGPLVFGSQGYWVPVWPGANSSGLHDSIVFNHCLAGLSTQSMFRLTYGIWPTHKIITSLKMSWGTNLTSMNPSASTGICSNYYSTCKVQGYIQNKILAYCTVCVYTAYYF